MRVLNIFLQSMYLEEVIHGEFRSVRLTDGVWATILEHGSGKFKLNVMNSKWILGKTPAGPDIYCIDINQFDKPL